MSATVNCATSTTNRMGIGNRLEKGGARYLNLKKTQAKDILAITGGVGASVLTATAVKNSSILQTGIKKAGEFIKNSNVGKEIAETAKKAMPYIQKGANWVKALPGPAKAALAVGLIATALISKAIRAKGLHNDGKIVQKYNDRAALQNTLA